MKPWQHFNWKIALGVFVAILVSALVFPTCNRFWFWPWDWK